MELLPGSGVYVDAAALRWLEGCEAAQLNGSRLVRRLVRELWPDERVLAASSCLGQSVANPGLDLDKVDAIRGSNYTLCMHVIFDLVGWPSSLMFVAGLHVWACAGLS